MRKSNISNAAMALNGGAWSIASHLSMFWNRFNQRFVTRKINCKGFTFNVSLRIYSWMRVTIICPQNLKSPMVEHHFVGKSDFFHSFSILQTRWSASNENQTKDVDFCSRKTMNGQGKNIHRSYIGFCLEIQFFLCTLPSRKPTARKRPWK